MRTSSFAYTFVMTNSANVSLRCTARTTAISALSLVVAYGSLPAHAASLTTGTPSGASAGQRVSSEVNDSRGDLEALLAVEDATEAIAEGETTGATAVTDARKAVSLWPSVRATLRQNGATKIQVVAVDGAIASLRRDLRSGKPLMRDANEVTGSLAPLFKIAGDKVPSGIHYLDYLGRSIALDVRGSDWARAQRDVHFVKLQWNAARPEVESRRGGPAAAFEFDRAARTISSAVASNSETKTRAATKMIGAAVDTVEKVYS